MRDKIRFWLSDKLDFSNLPKNLCTLNFGIQKVVDGYELYQFGYGSFHEDHDTWMLDEIYGPIDNFLNIEDQSSDIQENEIYEIYRSEVIRALEKEANLFTNHQIRVTITFFVGQPELLKAASTS